MYNILKNRGLKIKYFNMDNSTSCDHFLSFKVKIFFNKNKVLNL